MRAHKSLLAIGLESDSKVIATRRGHIKEGGGVTFGRRSTLDANGNESPVNGSLPARGYDTRKPRGATVRCTAGPESPFFSLLRLHAAEGAHLLLLLLILLVEVDEVLERDVLAVDVDGLVLLVLLLLLEGLV